MKESFTFFGLALACNVIIAQQGQEIQRLVESRLVRVADSSTGPIPDYSQLYFWAASPFKHDCSDSIPSFLKGEVRDSSADVFYIHPTTYRGEMKTAAWNADLSDKVLNAKTDLRPILYQASVFNGSCRVFAPRYRQANLKAFFIRYTSTAQRAFDTAYTDVRHAFQFYLDHYNQGRPIVIAAHSQGTLHAIRLLQDYFDGKPLQKQLVCAYLIGYQIENEAFKNIPVGNSPTSTGCIVGWRSFRRGTVPRYIRLENGNCLCVNPLTWTTSVKLVSQDLNLGTLGHNFNKVYPHVVSAGIDSVSHVLWVAFSPGLKDHIKNQRNLHVADYNLFWMNIRENVKQRIAAYYKDNTNNARSVTTVTGHGPPYHRSLFTNTRFFIKSIIIYIWFII